MIDDQLVQWISSEIKLKRCHCTRHNSMPYSGSLLHNQDNKRNERIGWELPMTAKQHNLPFEQVLSCWDPHPIAKIPSNPRLIPYHSPDSIPTILWDSDTMLTKLLNSEHPLRPPTYYHRSPRTPNSLHEHHISVFICFHHSVFVLLNSDLIFTSPSQFSPFHFWYIKPFQYSCSLILASTLPMYISTSLLLNSSNSL